MSYWNVLLLIFFRFILFDEYAIKCFFDVFYRNVQLEIQVRNIYYIIRLVPTLPNNVEDASGVK